MFRCSLPPLCTVTAGIIKFSERTIAMTKYILKIFTFLLAALTLCFSLSACNIRFEGNTKKHEKLYIVCTIFPQYDFIRNIAGEKADVEMLLPIGGESHTFGVENISVAKLDELHEADLFIHTGGESDRQLAEDLKKILTDAEFIALTDLVSELLEELVTEGMETDHDTHEHGHENTDFDEHVWTSPKRALELVPKLTDSICLADPENQTFYRHNAAEYVRVLENLDEEFEHLISGAKYKTLIFADRFPFRYLCHDYGIEADAAFDGCSTAVEPSLSTLDHLYRKATELQLPAILYMEGSEPSYAQMLAKRIGGEALLLHSCHIVSEEEYKTGSYVSIQKRNLETLKKALGN